MPKFIDHHSMPPMTPEQRKKMETQLKAEIKSGKPNSFGVTALNVFMGQNEAWGYNEAPNVEAIVKQHASLGVKIAAKDVVEVTPLA